MKSCVEFQHVVLAVTPSENFGREARVVATFERRVDSDVCEQALNNMVKSAWYGGNKNVVHTACAREQIIAMCQANGIHFTK